MSLDLWATHDEVGFDYGSLFNVFGGLLQGGGNMLAEKQANDAANEAMGSKLAVVKQADVVAVNAMVAADLSVQAKSKTAPQEAAKAKKAIAEADQAAAGLNDEGKAQRIAAVDEIAATMKKNLAAAPNDIAKKAQAKAWTAYSAKLHNPLAGAKVAEQPTTESWFTRPVLGPIPGAGIVVGGAVLVGVAALVIVKLVARKK